ncbi:hypothetical protein TNCV_1120391 [Trichonephila clavipes]|uniref:Uncharacterized protein n=1 Tax=Trichonephila clavipes TaxID=2585209 RepID=A0A8X6T0L0_TRICX|nr:hypothetical protein TNCV_1120391 [Trichonephila clavipes]
MDDNTQPHRTVLVKDYLDKHILNHQNDHLNYHTPIRCSILQATLGSRPKKNRNWIDRWMSRSETIGIFNQVIRKILEQALDSPDYHTTSTECRLHVHQPFSRDLSKVPSTTIG